MLTQWLKPARGCKPVLLSLVTNLIDCILPFTYRLLPIAYCTLTYCTIGDTNRFFSNRSHNCHKFCNITLMKSMTKVLTVNSTAWLYRLSILDGCISKLGNVCTARFLFLAITFLFSKSVSYFSFFCGCVFVQLWISYSLHSSAAWLAAAFWATALWSNDHCLGDLCFLPKLQAPTRHLDKCQSSISVFVYFVFLLPVPPIPNAARSTATKGGRFCVFLLFSKLLSKHKKQNYKRFHNNDFRPSILILILML